MTEELKRCPFCGETRPHFVPGGYCVKILKAKLDEARSELENERDTRKNELGNGTLIAINNAQAAEIAELKRIRGTMAETITQQEAELAQAREALRACEWDEHYGGSHCCPWCGQTKEEGHMSECIIMAALKPEEK